MIPKLAKGVRMDSERDNELLRARESIYQIIDSLEDVRSENQFLQLVPSTNYRSAYRKVFWREICSHARGRATQI